MSATDPLVEVPFSQLPESLKLNAVYALLLSTKELTVALQDQITELTTKVDTLTAAVTTLGEKVDAEQAEVAAAIALLSADNPDIAAALVKLNAVSTNLGTITADVESTVTPPA